MSNQSVLINILSARGGGGSTYIENIIPELVKQGKGIKFTLIFSSRYQMSLVSRFSSYDLEVHDTLLPANPLIRFCWEQIVLPFLIKKQGIDLLLSVTETVPFFAPCPVVMLARNPNIYQPVSQIKGWSFIRWKMIRLPISLISFKKAIRTIFVSDSSKKYVQWKYKLPSEKLLVIHHGLNSIFFNHNNMVERESNNSPYILAVSNFMKHKNYHNLIRAISILKNNLNLSYSLKIAGKPDEDCFPEVKRLTHELGLDEQVHFCGEVPNCELPRLYREATLFVLPSVLETFGQTLVEAMASGVPIIASDLDVISEVCHDAAVYFNPLDPKDMAEKALMVIKNHSLRQELQKKGLKRAKDFSWEKTAGEMLKVFEEVCNC